MVGWDQSPRFALREEDQRIASEPFIQAALVPAREHVKPGEPLAFLIENRGSAPIFFGLDYELDREDGDRWTNVNVEKYPPLPSLRLEPGGCRQLTAVIPDDARLGRYRLSMAVSTRGSRTVTAADIEVCYGSDGATRAPAV